ncbi:MAG: hypothetical protein VW405_11910 [Rhodospirillaceae bacterium]
MKVKISAPTATAPTYCGPGRRPTTAMSTAPSRGSEMFDRITGPASRQVLRFQFSLMRERDSIADGGRQHATPPAGRPAVKNAYGAYVNG